MCAAHARCPLFSEVFMANPPCGFNVYVKIHTVVHYDDVIMGAIASQITSLTIVYSTVYSGADQSKHQSSASLAFVWGIHRGSPHKWPVTRKMFPFDDVIMPWGCWYIVSPQYAGFVLVKILKVSKQCFRIKTQYWSLLTRQCVQLHGEYIGMACKRHGRRLNRTWPAEL